MKYQRKNRRVNTKRIAAGVVAVIIILAMLLGMVMPFVYGAEAVILM